MKDSAWIWSFVIMGFTNPGKTMEWLMFCWSFECSYTFFFYQWHKVMSFHINESNVIKKEFSKHFSCFKAALAFWYWPKSATASRLFLNLCYILWSYTMWCDKCFSNLNIIFLNNKPLCDYIMIYPRTFFYHQIISLFCFDFLLLSLFQLVF